jgi:hypothetical protein
MDASFKFRPLAAAICACVASTLAGCGPSQPERAFATDPNAAVTGQFAAGQALSAPITAKSLRDETANFAVISLPPAAVRGGGRVVDKQFLNGWRQSTSLDTAREGGDWNDLSIDIQGAPGSGDRSEIAISKPTQDGVRREILARFRSTPMRIVNRPMYNSLGPYGLAIGAAGAVRCAYAWQWVDNLPAAIRGEKATFFNSGEMAASIRMRLCRRGVTADELAQWYEEVTVSPQNLARVAEAIRANAMRAQPVEAPVAAAAPSGLSPVVRGVPPSERVTASVDSLESPPPDAGRRPATSPAGRPTPPPPSIRRPRRPRP